MDFLNKAFAQLTDLFRSMTPGARILAGLLIAVIVVSLGYLFNHQVSGGDVHLMGGRNFSANELPTMEAAFDKAGLKNYTIDGNQIRVPRAQQSAYMGALAENGAMPAEFYSYLDKAVDSGRSPFVDKHQREELLKNGKQQELAAIIHSMSGIENAVVHYDSKKKGGLKLSETLTASVTVKPRGSLPLERNRIQMIRHLVASSYAGLAPESVTVIDMNGRTYPAGSADDPIGGDGHKHLAAMEQYQERYKHEILDALAYVPGATVHVNVEIDKVINFKEEKVQVDPKPVMVSTSEETKTETTSSAPAGGRPGLPAQAPGANQALTLQNAGGGGSKSETEFNSSRGQMLVSHGKTQTEEIGLTPKRITVAIGVPVSHYAKIWREQNPAVDGQPKKSPTTEELKQIEKEHITKIKEHVGQLLPKPVGVVDPVPLVSVTSFHDTVVEAVFPTVNTAEQVLGLLGNYGSTIGMVVLALFSLLMLRSMLRAAPIESSASSAGMPEIVSTAVSAEKEDQSEDESAAPRVKRPKKTFGKGPSLKDELVELVRDDPDAAANILRGWIGNPN